MGLGPGWSCIDHRNTVRIIIEQSVECNTHLWLIFIDFERVFDTVSHESVKCALINKGIPGEKGNLVKELYNNTEF